MFEWITACVNPKQSDSACTYYAKLLLIPIKYGIGAAMVNMGINQVGNAVIGSPITRDEASYIGGVGGALVGFTWGVFEMMTFAVQGRPLQIPMIEPTVGTVLAVAGSVVGNIMLGDLTSHTQAMAMASIGSITIEAGVLALKTVVLPVLCLPCPSTVSGKLAGGDPYKDDYSKLLHFLYAKPLPQPALLADSSIASIESMERGEANNTQRARM